jgi:hypothetical protein
MKSSFTNCGEEDAYRRRKLGEEIKHDYFEEVRQG